MKAEDPTNVKGKLFGVSSDMKRHVDSVHLKIPNVWKRRSKLKKED